MSNTGKGGTKGLIVGTRGFGYTSTGVTSTYFNPSWSTVSPYKAKSKVSKNFKIAGERNWFKRRIKGIKALNRNLCTSKVISDDEVDELIKIDALYSKILEKYSLGYKEAYEKNK